MPWQTYNTVKVFQCYHLPTPAPHFGGTVNKQPLMVSFSSLNHLPSPWFPCSMTEKVFYFVVLFACIFIFYFKQQQQHMGLITDDRPPPPPRPLWFMVYPVLLCFLLPWLSVLTKHSGRRGFVLLTVDSPTEEAKAELKAGTWSINHREANKAYWLPGHIQPPSSQNPELGVVWSVRQDLPT